MALSAGYWIQHLQLTRHVEGGSFNQTYRSALILPQQVLSPEHTGARPAATAIYFLLEKDQFSAMHRIASDEIWHFYYGDPLIVYEINPEGLLTTHLLGNNPENAENFQCLVKAGSWFGSKTKEGGQYALVGCTVAPGFDYEDFELGNRNDLQQLYPQHRQTIEMLTH